LDDTTSGTAVDTLTLNAISKGAWGNSIKVATTASQISAKYFNLVVSYGSASSVVERFTDITMDKTDPRYAVSVINGSSAYITAVDAASSDTFQNSDNPAVIAATELSGGLDGTAATTTELASATTQLDGIDNSLILNVPGLTTTTDVNTVLTYAEARGDIFVVVDALNDTVSAQTTRATAYNASSFGAVYYPNLTIPDPMSSTAGATVTAPCGAAVVAKIVSTDAARGVFKAPAGLDTRISGAVSVSKLSNADLDALNSNAHAVNAIRYIPGSGIVVMGARTLKPGYADRYVPVRRSLIYLRKALTDITSFAIFEPNDQRLWNRINSTLQTFLTDYWSQGGLRGATPQDAYFVKCDKDNNTSSSIDNGEVHIEVGVALQRPAEFVVIHISQNDSGTVVTVS
jgi:phage tail sheath protein FI